MAGPKRFAASGSSLRPSDSIVERGSAQRREESARYVPFLDERPRALARAVASAPTQRLPQSGDPIRRSASDATRKVAGYSVETELGALDVLHHEARLVDTIGTQ